MVTEAADLEVAAEVDEGDDLDALTGCDVVVDFTHPGVVLENLRWCAEHDLDVVVGTSGFAEDRLEEVRGWLPDHPDGARPDRRRIFSIGAVLMMRFAAAGRQVLRVRRGHRAAPRQQGGCPVWDGAAHRRHDRHGAERPAWRPAGRHRVIPAGRPRRRRGRRPRPLGAGRGWSLIRRCSSAGTARRSPSGTTRWTGLVHARCAARRPRSARCRPGVTVGIEGLLGLD